MATKAKAVTPTVNDNPVWDWLRDETNRKVIAWFGSGLVVLAGGSWGLYEKLRATPAPTPSPPAIAAEAPAPSPASPPTPSAPTGQGTTVITIGGKGIVTQGSIHSGPIDFSH